MGLKHFNGFTIVETMLVVAIIALLASIIVPNLLHARLSSNDSLARSTLRSISTAAETFASDNRGNYPADITSLTGASPAYLNSPYCGQMVSGYAYSCSFGAGGYTFTAAPVNPGTSGSTTFTIVTGGALSP